MAALQVLQVCVRGGQPLAQLLQGLELFPQTLLNVRLQPGQDWKTHAALARTRAQAEAALQGQGRVLIRASGTEPLLRVMVEAREAALAHGWAERLVASLSESP